MSPAGKSPPMSFLENTPSLLSHWSHWTKLPAAALLVIAGSTLAGCTTSYEFDSATVGDDGAGRVPHARSNSQFIHGVYTDLLGRAPTVYDFSVMNGQGTLLYTFPINEQRDLVSALDGMGDSAPLRAALTAGLLGSTEITLPEKSEVGNPGAFIADQFRSLLGREPGRYEQRAFEDAWNSDDAVGPRTVIRAIIGSREYQSQ